jgi:hypothetical protein
LGNKGGIINPIYRKNRKKTTKPNSQQINYRRMKPEKKSTNKKDLKNIIKTR